MKILHLTLKKKWFDEIASGRKKVEYRKITDYWEKRLMTAMPDYVPKIFDEVHFRNGYRIRNPFMRLEWKGLEFGVHENETVYAIQLGKILEIRNYEKSN